LVGWLLVILSPCVVLTLAFQQEIMITWSDVPEDALRVWVVSERRLRGLGISTARRVDAVSPAAPQGKAVCTVIDTRFLLWEGSADSAHQCSCYVRQNERWQSVAEGQDACRLAGE
jgi:hypothetical protein